MGHNLVSITVSALVREHDLHSEALWRDFALRVNSLIKNPKYKEILLSWEKGGTVGDDGNN